MTGDSWIEIGRIADIPVRGSRRVPLGGRNVAVFRTGEDEIFALIDRCPHRGGPLSEGIISGRNVTCPLHNWLIDLRTGCAHAPDEGATKTVGVKLDGERIFLSLSPVSEGLHTENAA
jgi:nitrite reductase (NADH) small subunit